MKEISLICAIKNNDYEIKRVDIIDKNLLFQLNNLGFVRGEKIQLKQSNYGKKSFLVSVMGISYALDKTICEKIYVNEK